VADKFPHLDVQINQLLGQPCVNHTGLTEYCQSRMIEESQEARKKMIADALSRQAMTQNDLANLIGRGLTTIQAWISGRSVPELTPEETIELCKALDCTVEGLAEMFPGRSRRRAAIREKHRSKFTKKSTQD
jgi:DNA-binding XRE family transcriptional regulator